MQVIAGSDDHFPDRGDVARAWRTTIPGARLHVVEGGPHFPNRTHRAEVQGVIAAFLTSLGV